MKSTKIYVTILSFLVLFSTFSFTVEKHYCGDFLMDVSFTGDADNCGMNVEKVKRKCCKDEVHLIEGQDELQQFSSDKFDLDKQQFVLVFYISYQDLFVVKQSYRDFYKDYPPPDNLKDFLVHYQSFLI